MRRLLLAAMVCSLAGIGVARAQNAISEKEIQALTDGFVAAWNKHDAKLMAATFASDSDLVNPFGRVASGRAEIEKLFTDEQSTAMKDTTYALSNRKVRFLSPAIAMGDWDGEIAGMRNPDGSAAAPFKHHVTTVYAKKDGHWLVAAGRAMAYLPPPPPPKPAKTAK